MPLRWNEETEQVEEYKTRGRKKGSGALDAAQIALKAPAEEFNYFLRESPVTTPDPETFYELLRETVSSISSIMRGNGDWDENVANELRKKGYDAEAVLGNTSFYSNILASLQDELMERAAQKAEEFGEFGGLGSVGETTVKGAGWGNWVKTKGA